MCGLVCGSHIAFLGRWIIAEPLDFGTQKTDFVTNRKTILCIFVLPDFGCHDGEVGTKRAITFRKFSLPLQNRFSKS